MTGFGSGLRVSWWWPLLSSATCASVEREPTSAARPPNVVVIVTDDQRAGTLHWLPTVRRQLVRRGTKFTRAMVPTSTCCPSRASILTGLFAQDTTVWANGGDLDGTPLGGWEGFSQAGMEDQTIATRLDPTHRTILVGKYLNGYDKAPSGHVPPGWDEWHSFWAHNGRYYDYQLVHTDGSMTHHGNRPAAYSTDVLRRLAVRSIVNTPPDEPLFLFFTPIAPHGPSTPAPRHEGLGARTSGASGRRASTSGTSATSRRGSVPSPGSTWRTCTSSDRGSSSPCGRSMRPWARSSALSDAPDGSTTP